MGGEVVCRRGLQGSRLESAVSTVRDAWPGISERMSDGV